MATFLQGVTDTPAPMQLYKPDYEFLTQVYNSRQSAYDKGFNYVKNLYNSQLNNPLTSLDNEKYRQDVFKKIQGTLKDASALDLANPANINYAMQAMDPITKDKQLAYDMHVTGIHQGELQKLETVRSSLDPKISGTYNEFSKKAIGYATSDLREAKRDDGSIFKVAPQKFIPYQDVVADLNKAAKEQKLDIEIQSATGTGYLVKTAGGEQAYKPYTKWALSAMGNKYNEQLQQQGYVEGEGVIRGTMQQKGIGRKEAIDQIATPMFKQLYQEAVANGTYSDARIKEYDLQISKFRDKFGNTGIDPNSSEGKALAKVIQQRTGYVNDLATAKADLNKMEEQGADYVTSNLYNIFTNQAKKRVATDWAITTADATKKQEVTSDATWVANMHEAHTDARHLQDMGYKYKALDETIRNNKFNNKIAQQNADTSWFKVKFGDISKMPTETYEGSFAGGKSYSVNVLHNDLNKVEDDMYNKAFASSDGLIGILYNSDKKDLQNITPIIAKIRNMADGDIKTLTPTEVATLTDFGRRSGIGVFNPANPVEAKYALRQMSMDIYERGKTAIANYKTTKNSKMAAEKLEKFEGIRDSFKKYANTMDHIEKNYENIASEVIDPKTNRIKDIYRGATITGFTRKGTPIVDFSGLEGDADTVASRMEMIQKRATPDYQGVTRSAGAKIHATNIKPEEYSQFFSHNINYSLEERGNLSKALSPEVIKSLYGSSADIAYDGGKEIATVTLKGNPAAIKAYNKATSGPKLQENYEFQMPYSHIKNNTGPLARLNKYVDANTVTSANTSTLNKLVTSPTSTVKSPEELKNGLGFEYSVVGSKRAGGEYGLHVMASFEDPQSGKEVNLDKFFPRQSDQTQAELVSEVERFLVNRQHAYESFRIQSDESFKSTNNVDFDNFINKIE